MEWESLSQVSRGCTDRRCLVSSWEQVLVSTVTEFATSGRSPTSLCVSGLPGRLGRVLAVCLRVELLLKTDSGYPKDTGVNKHWQPLRIPSAITPNGQFHQSPPSPIPGDLGRGPSHQSTCSNIETRMDRPGPKSVVRVIRGVA